MKQYNLYQIDAFTTTKFTGNPAGVITNAEGLSQSDMQQIARELNNSETAFVFPGQEGAYDVEVRFFTPTHEVPICGHATIAAHYARAIENQMASAIVLQKTGAGTLPVQIIKEDGDYRIVMTQGQIVFGSVLEGDVKHRLLMALQLSETDLIEKHKIQIVSTGHSKVMIGIKSLEVLHKLKPDNQALSELSKVIQCNGYYVYTMSPESPEFLVHGRMFAPAIGIQEDPVTGNANGPLGAYLVHHKLVQFTGGTFKFEAIQGEAIQRAGVVSVEVAVEAGEPVQVQISGRAVTVFRAMISKEIA